MTRGSSQFTRADAKALFKEVDTDGSGTVNYEEFASKWATIGGDDAQVGMATYVETRGLEEMTREAKDGTVPVRLLRGTWLCKKGYTRPKRLPLRQELEVAEPEAFADAALLKACLKEVGSVKGDSSYMSFPGVVVLS